MVMGADGGGGGGEWKFAEPAPMYVAAAACSRMSLPHIDPYQPQALDTGEHYLCILMSHVELHISLDVWLEVWLDV